MSNSWHIKNWFRVGKRFSWSLSFNTLCGLLALNKSGDCFLIRHADKKHEFILDFLEREFSGLIEEYKNVEEAKSSEYSNAIWTVWWTGRESAPPLVKACLESIERNANGRELIVLSKDNIKEYIELPEYIIALQKSGKMSMANMCDLIRVMLLSEYGGLWLDSTIFAGNEIPKDLFKEPFYSLHTKYSHNCYVQHNLYHIFVLGSIKGGKLVSFVRDLFLEYWKRYDVIIDYFLLDYTLAVAYRNFPDIREEIDNLEYTSERLYDMVNVLSLPYDEGEFIELCSSCLFSKLDWHRKYKEQSKGQMTLFSHVIGQMQH